MGIMNKTISYNICSGRTLRIVFGITAIMTLTVMQGALAHDWSMFRHDPAHTGISSDTVSPPLNLLWNYTTGFLVPSSPAVSGGVVYVGLCKYMEWLWYFLGG